MTGVATQGGFSDRLRNPTDLLAKMRHDLDRLEADPSDDYAAFDYFIAAHHIETIRGFANGTYNWSANWSKWGVCSYLLSFQYDDSP